MSGFSVDWLNLREDADHRARNHDLLRQALDWLTRENPSQGGQQVVDLGAGTGSTLRAFQTLGDDSAAALQWRLLDHDPVLLAEAHRRHGDKAQLETCQADLATVAALPLAGARLVTASALFDLVSADFLATLAGLLAAQCRQQPVGIYAALNYDGTTRWDPIHPLDRQVLAAFNQDQRRDKGFGPALGPASGTTMERLFKEAGFTVRTAPSPWLLDGRDQAMTRELINGIAGAVAGSPGIEKAALNDWRRFRLDRVSTGTCEIGHLDVLALPAQRRESAGS